MPMSNDKYSLHSVMSKLDDVGDQIPKAYCISKYDEMGTEINQNHKWKHIK